MSGTDIHETNMSEQTKTPVTDDLRIRAIKQLMTPRSLMDEIPVEPAAAGSAVRRIRRSIAPGIVR